MRPTNSHSLRSLGGGLALVLAVSACGSGATTVAVERAAGAPAVVAAPASSSTTATIVSTTTTTATTVVVVPAAAPTTVAPAPTTTTRVPVPRVVVQTGFAPFAHAESLTLFHPAAQIERIGFHESGHDGARQMDPTANAARPMVMETRERGTGDRTAADIVVPPDEQIRVPVTGTVKRAGGYILYCEHQDDFAVIEPDDRPGWEVKIFHIDGVAVRKGDRVEAGVTLLAPRATQLPFESQVDEFTGEPSWPHVHVEVVDPSIPDRPSSGGGC